MTVTATEFRKNLGKYLTLASKQNVFIVKNGKRVARLTSPEVDKIAVLDSLVGIIPAEFDTDPADIKEERGLQGSHAGL